MKTPRLAIVFALSLAAAACGTPMQQPAPDAAADQAAPQPDASTPTSDAAPPSDAQSPEDSSTPAADGGPSEAPTWWRDIKPLVDQTCNNCHRTGGIGPFELSTYAQARPLSRVMANSVQSRTMPPWQAREGCRTLLDSRALTDVEIAKFVAWDAAGAPEGNMADFRPAAARPNTTMPLPATPGDVIVQPSADYLPNQRRTDDYHCFIVDPGLTASRDVVGVRVVPGNARIVHHMLLFEVRAGGLAALQRLDDAEPGPGYTCYGGPGVDANVRAGTGGDLVDMDMQQVAGWAPGGVDGYMPAGTGIRLKPGNRLVMQVHYNLAPSTMGMTDRTRVELFLGAPGATQQALWLPQPNSSFSVPAGAGPMDPRSTAVSSTRNPLPIPARIHGVFPHMHQRGYSIRVEAITSSGTTNCLADVPRWDFHWQQNYFFRSAYRAAAGTNADTLRTTCVWDNRPENQPFVDGMQVAPRTLTWGEGSDDEMCLNYYYVSL